MIQVIYGKKGSGKTKRILDMANHMVDTQHGDVVFVDDDNRYMFDLRHEVRFVNAGEYGIRSADMFFGFLAGMLATNFDVKVIFIDAFLKLTKTTDIAEMGWFFEKLDALSEAHNCKFLISVSAAENVVPDYIQKYVI